MTPEYLEELADFVDPDQLWKQGAFSRLDMPEEKRRQLDAGVALRRHADHIRQLRQLMHEGRSLLITPLSENGTAVKSVSTPADHARLRSEGRAGAARGRPVDAGGKPTKRERLRDTAMLQAYLQFHASKFSREDRERGTWLLLFVWAWHGGKAGDPIPGGNDGH